MPTRPNKTQATTASVEAFIEKLPKEEVRNDSRTLMKLMHELTGAEPYMYGPTIVGYGTYHYTYASGHEGDAPLAGGRPALEFLRFAVRDAVLADIVFPEMAGQAVEA